MLYFVSAQQVNKHSILLPLVEYFMKHTEPTVMLNNDIFQVEVQLISLVLQRFFSQAYLYNNLDSFIYS